MKVFKYFIVITSAILLISILSVVQTAWDANYSNIMAETAANQLKSSSALIELQALTKARDTIGFIFSVAKVLIGLITLSLTVRLARTDYKKWEAGKSS